jgi:RNA polymerase sigma factor (TIGR02999 family)
MSATTTEAPITRLLLDWKKGDRDAGDELFRMVYQELHRVAEGRMRQERSDHTLQPAALVHEAWLRLAGSEGQDWQSRSHFYGVAARLMRQVLIDHARARSALRRQAGLRVDLTGSFEPVSGGDSPDAVQQLLELHEALEKLAALDERRARVVELRYFGGLERAEIAEILGMTERMVKRDLMLAQAWLKRVLCSEKPNDNHDP